MGKKSLKIAFIILWILPLLANSQSKLVWLHGKVISQSNKRPIPLAQIASYKKMNVYVADSVGEFRIILDSKDSIRVLALGFDAHTFSLNSFEVDADRMYTFSLKPIAYQIEQIDINANKHYNDYMENLKAMRRKQMEMDLQLPSHIQLGRKPDVPVDILPSYRRNPPVLAAILQPANFIYYHTAKSEKQKRKMMKVLKYEKQRQYMTNEMMQKISGLKGDKLNGFIIYCNANIKFEKNDTPLSIKYKVVDLFEAYKRDKND
ncbi:hypothetical protein [Carboxylicivirga marina]|uniref:hypothetical protein n=1 Tax=Carboxylicivirga marina TaxID=2800988 RepID=UPI002598F90A|nr:hypothetical protein [uncultured Carboxylicivirga sp.]